MQKFLIYIFVIVTTTFEAQTIVEKGIQSNATDIYIELDVVDAIKIVHNTKNLVSVSMESEYQNKYTLQITEENNEVVINSKLIHPKQRQPFKLSLEKESFSKLTINLPKHKNVTIKYRKGNFNANSFIGNLKLQAENSNVTISNYAGNVSIFLIAGFITCSVQKSKIDITTSKGRIVNEIKDKKLIETIKSIKGEYKKGKNSLKIKTIYANVLLKAFKTQ